MRCTVGKTVKIPLFKNKREQIAILFLYWENSTVLPAMQREQIAVTPSLISLVVSVDVKQHVYLLKLFWSYNSCMRNES